MHVVIVGCGRVGSGLAVALEQTGHTVAIIDKNRNAFRRIGDGFGGQTLVGLGFDRDVLLSAGIERAKAFAAVTSGDNSNILSARIARETYQIPSVVARIYDPRRAAIYQRLGIATVATVAWTTDQVMRRLFPDTVSNWTDQSGTLSLVERTLPDHWAGRRLGDLTDGDRFRLVAISRAGQARLAAPEVLGQEGDVLHLMVRSDAAADLESRLDSDPKGGH
jgi:trk system potassium uptake protein TrkA